MYYTFESGDASSRFPIKVMDKHDFKNVTNEVALYINTIKNYQAQGKYEEAAEYLASIQRQIDLTPYVLSMNYLNFLDEETRNLEIYIKSQKQQIFYQTDEPELAITGDVWIYTA